MFWRECSGRGTDGIVTWLGYSGLPTFVFLSYLCCAADTVVHHDEPP